MFKTCPGAGGQGGLGSGGQGAASGACEDGCAALRAERPYYQYAYWFEGCGGGG
ncbi:MAG: hypothetical protein HY908_27315 [Myxococcales bacterium]|nr:hypothetical protein [Myxococcales bacterium]